MRSAFLRIANTDLELKNFDIPQIGPRDVLIKLKFAALNHRDLWTIKGQYRGKTENLILGSDGSGEIIGWGESVSNHLFKIGLKVFINPSLNWGDDINAQGPNFEILGNPNQGTFSEFISVPFENVLPIPDHFNLEEAAALPLAGLTAYRSLFTKGLLKRNENILITGIGGGVAQMAFQMAISFGANVFISSSSESKIKNATENGAIAGFNYNENKWLELAKKEIPNGFDLILDSAAGPNFLDLIELTKPGGRIVLYGGTAGLIGPIIPAKIFWRQIQILGTTMGSSIEFQNMIEFYKKYKIKPIIDQVFSFEDINLAFKRMDSKLQTGKILIKITDD